MLRIRDDLLQTTPRGEEGTETASFLLLRPEGNVLFYNSFEESELEEMAALGGVRHQLLSHRHEVMQGPVERLRERFSPELCADSVEAEAMARVTPVDRVLAEGDRVGGVACLPTPGHTAGGLSFVYPSPGGETYLFDGDTFLPVNGRWIGPPAADDGGDPAILAASLRRLRELAPDLVLPSTVVGEWVREMTPEAWRAAIDLEIARLEA